MWKKLCALLLALALTAALSPALAAEGDGDAAAQFPAVRTYEGFSDVDEAAWYAPYVKICYETGLMSGTGGGKFNPGGEVSCVESAVLAARVHQILSGGDGTLPRTPDDWGKITLTCSDGVVLTGFGSDDMWSWSSPGPSPASEAGLLNFALHPARFDWAEGQDGKPMELEIDGKRYTGTAVYWTPNAVALSFCPKEEDAAEIRAVFQRKRPGPNIWYRDAAYYLETAGLGDIPGLSYSEYAATRLAFVQGMAAVTGELLTPGGAIATFPDAEQYGQWTGHILAFYNLGLLAGVDSQGTFAGEKTLTRAETAAILARLARPELRIKPEPAPADESGLAPFEENGLWGLRDAAGRTAVPAQYAYVMQEEDGFFVATDTSGKKGIFSPDGTLVIPFLYSQVYNSPDEQRYVVVGTDGDYASPLHYNGKKGMIDGQGNIVIPLEYDFLFPFENGRASFMRGEVYGHLLPDGAEVTGEEIGPDDPLYPVLVLMELIEQQKP